MHKTSLCTPNVTFVVRVEQAADIARRILAEMQRRPLKADKELAAALADSLAGGEVDGADVWFLAECIDARDSALPYLISLLRTARSAGPRS